MVESFVAPGHPAPVLAKMVMDAVDAAVRVPGGKLEDIAKAAGMSPSQLSNLRKAIAADPDYTIKSRVAERLLAAAHCRLMIVPKDMVAEVEALLARRPPPLADDVPVAALDLSARSSRVLAAVSVETVGQLCAWTAEQLLATPGFGPSSLKEVETVLGAHGRRLRGGAS